MDISLSDIRTEPLKGTFVNFAGIAVVIKFGPYKQLLEPSERVTIVLNDQKWMNTMKVEGYGKFKDGTRIPKQTLPFPDRNNTMYIGYHDVYFDRTHTPLMEPMDDLAQSICLKYKPESSRYLNERSRITKELPEIKDIHFNPKIEGDVVTSKAAYDKEHTRKNFIRPNQGEKPYYENRLWGLIIVDSMSSSQVSSINFWSFVILIFLFAALFVAIFIYSLWDSDENY